jgi:A/G-specific adenine glycosylase
MMMPVGSSDMRAPKERVDINPSSARKQRNTRAVRLLLDWYRVTHRRLPWRAQPGERQDPYAVWLSEVMLQQTTVTAVIPYFLTFMKRWPDFNALARADAADIMAAWAGLGYYSRARNLHACAQQVASGFGGVLPDEEAELLKLPGIGPYTAAAIAAIAFGRQAAPVDGNIERVLSRFMAIEAPLPQSKPEIRAAARDLAPERDAGDFAQAMMDLGATVCTPRAPACETCPWNTLCEGRKRGIADELPRRAARKARPLRRGATLVLLSEDGEVYLERRAGKGLLAGMHGTPVTSFEAEPTVDIASLAPAGLPLSRLAAPVIHTFTHFDLELQVYVARTKGRAPTGLGGEWAPLGKLASFALPTLFRKVIRAAVASAEPPKKKGRRSP